MPTSVPDSFRLFRARASVAQQYGAKIIAMSCDRLVAVTFRIQTSPRASNDNQKEV